MESLVLTKEELSSFARDFAFKVESRPNRATIVALSGELGAGKTFFTQNLAKALGIEMAVKSPTFVIEKIYDLGGQKWDRLVHIDAYRLESKDDLGGIGWDGLVNDPRNLIVVEWPEKIAGGIPEDVVTIKFKTIDDERREVIYD